MKTALEMAATQMWRDQHIIRHELPGSGMSRARLIYLSHYTDHRLAGRAASMLASLPAPVVDLRPCDSECGA